MELIRFYFGSSSSLLATLFTTGLDKDALFTSAHLETRPGLATLQLAEGIPRASAHDVARIAFDDIAWRAAVLISRSCLRASVRGSEIFPQGVFPFQGKTTLQLKGKWLSRAGQPRQTFLVYEMRSCSFAFPYSVLCYRVAGGQTSDTTRQGAADTTDAKRRAASRTSKPRAPSLNEHDASRHLAPDTAYLPRVPRFPDLTGKLTFGDETVEQELPLSAAGAPTPAIESMAESPKWAHGHAAPQYLAPLLAALDRFAGDVKLLTASDQDGWTIPVNMSADVDGVIDEALLEQGVARRLCTFRVTAGTADGVLVALGTSQVLYLIVPIDPGTEIVDASLYMQSVIDAAKAQHASQPMCGPAPTEAQSPPTSAALAAWLAQWAREAPGDLRRFALPLDGDNAGG